MPRTHKKAQRKSVRAKTVKKPLESAPIDLTGEDMSQPSAQGFPEGKPKKVYLIGTAVVLASLLLVYLFKNGMIVSAIVNGRPVFSWQLNSVLARRFGAQTLEGIVTERLIQDEARKQNVSVSDTDVTGRQQEMLESIGGKVSLDDLLKYQGITREEFDNQIRMQLIVERILGKDITITDSDVSAFIASYSSQMLATDEAAMKEEARQAIFEQEISKKVQTWYADIKAKASIIRFL